MYPRILNATMGGGLAGLRDLRILNTTLAGGLAGLGDLVSRAGERVGRSVRMGMESAGLGSSRWVMEGLTESARTVLENTTGVIARRFADGRGMDDIWTKRHPNETMEEEEEGGVQQGAGGNGTHRGAARRRRPSLRPSRALARIVEALGNGTAGLRVVRGGGEAGPWGGPMDERTLTALLIAFVTMIGSFLSALVGFAFALTTTSLLSNLVGSKVAQPLVAILFFVNQGILMHKRGLGDWGETGVLIAASFVTVPVGIFLLVWVEGSAGEQTLGALIVAYVLYAFADFRLPELQSRWHTVATGLFAGLTVGAFNIGGPWIAMYGQCRRWKADKFASNLITYQAPTCVLALSVHVFRGSYKNQDLWYYCAVAVPGMVIGSQMGEMVSRRMNEATFKTLTMSLIAVMGTRLLLTGVPAHHAATVLGFLGAALGGVFVDKMRRKNGSKKLAPHGGTDFEVSLSEGPPSRRHSVSIHVEVGEAVNTPRSGGGGGEASDAVGGAAGEHEGSVLMHRAHMTDVTKP